MNGGALFNAEFGIRHRGSTVPERSGVALSFCRRQVNPEQKPMRNAAWNEEIAPACARHGE
ncbi:hypothetical protein IPC1319_31205 [Pseudomonas aeruginosa]|nr:hypothetical protein IPC1319_31205 [Pseudomonas aeruginosa]